jgi:DNA-binding response OmpR family regulator
MAVQRSGPEQRTLAWPIGMAELTARVEVVLRRVAKPTSVAIHGVIISVYRRKYQDVVWVDQL